MLALLALLSSVSVWGEECVESPQFLQKALRLELQQATLKSHALQPLFDHV